MTNTIIMLILTAALVLPVAAMLIYLFAFKAHANRVLAEGGTKKRWLPPYIVLIIALGAEALFFAGFSIISTLTAPHREIDLTDNKSHTYTAAEVKGTPYEIFNGGEVKGYTLENKTDGDFTYSLYQREADNELPKYVAKISYHGIKNTRSFFGTCLFKNEGGGLASSGSASDTYIAAIDTEEKNVNYRLSLYDNDFGITDSHQTKSENNRQEIPEPAAELNLVFE